MKKSLHKLFILSIATLLGVQSFSQNQVYWREGFEPSGTPACDLTTTNPTAAVSYYFNGNAGVWYGNNVYRTTGTGCASAGLPHVRFRNINGVTDSGYLVTPIVDAGINEFHFLRARASRSYTLWVTNDTLATTTNWTPVVLVRSSASTVTCVDTTVIINSPTARRLKIVGRPGTDTDIDSVFITSVGVITPVKFGGLSASEANNFVKLNWNIETEVNINNYTIERSANGDVYTQIGVAAANKSVNYSWVDNAPNNGTNFYRIKATDKDGSIQYSSILRINVGKIKTGLTVYPNPVKGGKVNVELDGVSKGEYKVNIYNMVGSIVHTATLVSEGTSVSKAITLPTNVTNGNYTLEITNGSFKSAKIISVQ